MAELTNPQNVPEPDGATLTIESNSDLGTLYSYIKTTPFTGTEAEKAAEIMANGVGQAPVVGTNTRVVTGQDTLTDYYAGWVQDSDGYGADLAMEFHIATDAETLTIPAGAGAYDFHIDWGDGIEEDLTTVGAGPHTYTLAGDYVVRISGTFPHISLIGAEAVQQLRKVLNLGGVGATSFVNSFYNAPFMAEFTVGAADTSLATIYNSMLRGSSGLTQGPDLTGLNLSNSTSILGILRDMSGATTPPNISGWDITSVARADSCFRGWSAMGAVDLALDEWDVTTCGRFTDMLLGSQLTTACYDRTLASWGNQTLPALAASYTINFGETSTYTDTASHALLLAQVGGIIDGGVAP